MTDGSPAGHDGVGSKPRIRQTPEHARQQRRRSLWAGLLALVMAVVFLAEGVDSVRTGEWVKFGRVGDSVDLPGWAMILIALFFLYLSGLILWRFARKT